MMVPMVSGLETVNRLHTCQDAEMYPDTKLHRFSDKIPELISIGGPLRTRGLSMWYGLIACVGFLLGYSNSLQKHACSG